MLLMHRLSESCIYCIDISFHASYTGYYPTLVHSHAVDVVRLGAGEAVQTLPPLAVRAPSL